MVVQIQNFLVYALAVTGLSWAHPGHDHSHEASVRARYLRENPRSLHQCAAKLKARGHEAVNIKRRQALAKSLRQQRGLSGESCLKPRDLDSVLETSHKSTNASFDLSTSPDDLFSDQSSCVLQPEATEGPYFVTGELIRRNVTNGEAGVPMTLDIQIIDTSNCEPVRDVYLDLWHSNATGVYSGVVTRGNGDSDDASNINNTAFRGIQKSDDSGIVHFDTVFPGHYAGRANHIHILTHRPNTAAGDDNNTVSDLVASHIGQLFFDQALQQEVEKLEPYSSNDQPLTANDEDMILAGEADSSDPMVRYVQLGDNIADGILAWISIGIDPTSTHDVRGTYYEGTVDQSNGTESTESGSGSGNAGSSGTAGGGATSGAMRLLPGLGWLLPF